MPGIKANENFEKFIGIGILFVKRQTKDQGYSAVKN
jgi:hypothetical protein